MENDVLITEENLMEFKDQDIEGLKNLLESDEFGIDTTPEPLELGPRYKICKCGSILYKNHKSEYRCGQCGCILF